MGSRMRRKSAVTALDAHLGYWLRFVSNQVSQAFSRKVAARNVSVAEWVILRELFDGESVVPSVLADRMGMTRGGISKLADRLVAKGLVTRTADDEDRRYQALALTAQGRALVPVLARLADENDDEFFGDLSAADRKKIESVMRDIVRRRGLKTVPVE